MQLSLDALRVEKDALLEKQGRFARFKTQRERDAWLNDESSTLSNLIKTQEQQLSQLLQDLSQTQEASKLTQKQIEWIQGKLSNRRSDIERLQSEFEEARLNRNKLDEKRKELWREDAKGAAVMDTMKQNLSKNERVLAGCMDRVCCHPLLILKSND